MNIGMRSGETIIREFPYDRRYSSLLNQKVKLIRRFLQFLLYISPCHSKHQKTRGTDPSMISHHLEESTSFKETLWQNHLQKDYRNFSI